MLKIVRKTEEFDIDQLLNVYREHTWDEGDFLSYLLEDFFHQPEAFYALWIEDAVYKSAVRLERYRDGMLLHSLETAPGARRKGYGYALLMDILEFLRTTNCRAVYSHIEKRNKASLNLHKKCGFKEISDFATYLDGTVTQNSATLCCYL